MTVQQMTEELEALQKARLGQQSTVIGLYVWIIICTSYIRGTSPEIVVIANTIITCVRNFRSIIDRGLV